MPDSFHRCVVFDSVIGWMALETSGESVQRLRVGLVSRNAAERTCSRKPGPPSRGDAELISRLQRFAEGQRTSLDRIRIDRSWMTEFQRMVINACRKIGWGETLTYGQLARIAGHPGASRAVGSVMAGNRFPLIVPCHRVTSTTGLGGFSAPTGIALKQTLLENEVITIATSP